MTTMDLLQQELTAGSRVLLVGPPGCGKTARVRRIAAAAGYKVFAWRLAQCDRVDVAGALVPDTDSGTTRQLPLEPLAKILASEEPTIWFLDDLGQAPHDVQAAVMRYFDAGELPPNVTIWAATNRLQDRAGVVGLIEPLRSRFDSAYVIPVPSAHEEARRGVAEGVPLGTWEDELRAWCNWAREAYPRAPEIPAWIALSLGDHAAELPRGLQPILYGWEPHPDPAVRLPDYRSWEAALRKWSAGLRTLGALAATIGRQQAQALLHWLEGLRAPTVEEIITSPSDAPLPEGCYTLMSERLRAYVTAPAANVEAAAEYITRWPAQWAFFAARLLYRAAPTIAKTRAWGRWFQAHKDKFVV